jgi:hypothetical protein
MIDIYGEKKGGMAHPGRSQGGLTACVTCPNHDHIIFFFTDTHGVAFQCQVLAFYFEIGGCPRLGKRTILEQS